MSHSELEFVTAPRLEQDVLEHYQTIRFAPIPEGTDYDAHQKNIDLNRTGFVGDFFI